MCSFEVKCINSAWHSRCLPELLDDTFLKSLIIISGHQGHMKSTHLCVHHIAEEKNSREMASPGHIWASLVTTSFAAAFCHSCNIPIF